MNTTSLSRESESNRKTPEDQGENKIEQKTKIHIVGDKLTYDNKTSGHVYYLFFTDHFHICIFDNVYLIHIYTYTCGKYQFLKGH